jgi:hypothetical protein
VRGFFAGVDEWFPLGPWLELMGWTYNLASNAAADAAADAFDARGPADCITACENSRSGQRSCAVALYRIVKGLTADEAAADSSEWKRLVGSDNNCVLLSGAALTVAAESRSAWISASSNWRVYVRKPLSGRHVKQLRLAACRRRVLDRWYGALVAVQANAGRAVADAAHDARAAGRC